MKGDDNEMDPSGRGSKNGDIWGALQEVVRDNPRFWLYFSSVMIQVREAVLERAAAASSSDFFPGYPKYRDVATQTETISVRDVGTQTEITDNVYDCGQDDKTLAICRKFSYLTESPQSPDDVHVAVNEDDKMAVQEENKMAVVEEDTKMVVKQEGKRTPEEENKMAAERDEQMASGSSKSGTTEKEKGAEIEEQTSAIVKCDEAEVQITSVIEVKKLSSEEKNKTRPCDGRSSGSTSKEKNETRSGSRAQGLTCIRCGKRGYEMDNCPTCSTKSSNGRQKPSSAPKRRRSRNRPSMRQNPYQYLYDGYSRYGYY